MAIKTEVILANNEMDQGFPLYVVTFMDKNEYDKISDFVDEDGFIEDLEVLDLGFDIFEDFDLKFKEVLKTKSELVRELISSWFNHDLDFTASDEIAIATYAKIENPTEEDFDKLINFFVTEGDFKDLLDETNINIKADF
jgi:hypothetical protein